MLQWYVRAFNPNYANFKGRASRREFWGFTAINILISALIGIPMGVIFIKNLALDAYDPYYGYDISDSDATWLGILVLIYAGYALVSLFPMLGVSIRRLHDTGRSGWWYILALIPYVNLIGSFVLIYFFCQESEAQPNAYGPPPVDNGTTTHHAYSAPTGQTNPGYVPVQASAPSWGPGTTPASGAQQTNTFILELQKAFKLQAAGIFSEEEYSNKKREMIKELAGANAPASPEDFLLSLVEWREKNALTAEEVDQIKRILLA